MNKNELLNKLNDIVYPIVKDKGYKLYHLEFVNEDKEYFLRIYIDNDNGISLDDCESVSRAISNVLDTDDPIPYSYYLEVSSPGIYRVLFTDEHLRKACGKKVCVMLNKSLDSKKKYEGILLDFDDEIIKINIDDSETQFERSNIFEINLGGEE